jgi:hypothetical protein
VVVGRFPFTALGRAQTYGSTEGLVKVVAERRYREVLGVHIVGPGASDLIPEGVLAMHLEATLDDIADTIHAHPTWARAPRRRPWSRSACRSTPPRPGRPAPAAPRGGAMAQTTPAPPGPAAARRPPRWPGRGRRPRRRPGHRPGSGRGGRIRRADVEAAAAPRAPAPPAVAAGRAGAAAAVEAPHFHLTVVVDAEAWWRSGPSSTASSGPRRRPRGDPGDLVVKACAGLLGLEPDLNVSFAGDRLLRHRRVHVGIAVPARRAGRAGGPRRRPQAPDPGGQEARDLTGGPGRRAGRRGPGRGDLHGLEHGQLRGRPVPGLIDPPQAAVLAVGAVRASWRWATTGGRLSAGGCG